MEFNQKLQQLRKQFNFTQEQLAEKLFVSRTAVSKWETGKGYPSIESLKNISNLFDITIDDLLSGEKIIDIAKIENQSNLNKFSIFIYGIIDVIAMAFIFLPLFGQKIGNYFYSVSLLQFDDGSFIIRLLYFAFLILITILGGIELIIQAKNYYNFFKPMIIASLVLDVLIVLLFLMTQQPYLSFFFFIFLIIKVFLLLKRLP